MVEQNLHERYASDVNYSFWYIVSLDTSNAFVIVSKPDYTDMRCTLSNSASRPARSYIIKKMN